MSQKNKYLIMGMLSLLGSVYFGYLALANGAQVNLLTGTVGLAVVTGYFLGLSKKY